MERAIDTLEMAKRVLPKSQVNLNELCKKFNIDTSQRVKHGALVDCLLLAEVYLQLLGGRQGGLSFETSDKCDQPNLEAATKCFKKTPRQRRDNLDFAPSTEELSRHEEFLKSIKSSLWLNNK
jgi:DNA polymerase-3 subunit epsilon